MMNNSLSSQKKLFVVALIAVLVLFSIILITKQRTPQKPFTVHITNLGSCTKNIHSEPEEDISGEIYSLVKSANDYNKKESPPSYEGTIREGSCKLLVDKNVTGFSGKRSSVKATSIILDIPEAKQSWKITFDWITKKEKVDTNLGDMSPECLPKEGLVYGDFNCEKIMSLARYGTDKYDPILQYMPYTGQGFYLEYNPNTRAVRAQIRVPEKEANNTELIENNKYAVSYWFKHRKLDIKNYKVSYEVIPL
jgi:hypothetical protein